MQVVSRAKPLASGENINQSDHAGPLLLKKIHLTKIKNKVTSVKEVNHKLASQISDETWYGSRKYKNVRWKDI